MKRVCLTLAMSSCVSWGALYAQANQPNVGQCRLKGSDMLDFETPVRVLRDERDVFTVPTQMLEMGERRYHVAAAIAADNECNSSTPNCRWVLLVKDPNDITHVAYANGPAKIGVLDVNFKVSCHYYFRDPD